jgi:outer membrane protein assembly factor BamB
MRGRRILSPGAALLILASTFLASAAPPMVVVPRQVEPGETVRILAEGFTPVAPVDVFLDEVDRALVMADETGEIDLLLDVPTDIGLGAHWITAMERGAGPTDLTGRVLRARLRVDVPLTTWPQLGGDAGRTGRASPDAALTSTVVGELHEVWYRDLEVLELGEEVFVTDVAGELAIPAIVDGKVLISTWFATDVLSQGELVRRAAITATDLVTGSIRWRRVAESRTFSAISFGPPVLAGDTVVARWQGDRVLLGLDSRTGEVRWRRAVSRPGRFGDPLVSGDRVVLPVERPGDALDGLLALHPAGGAVLWERPTAKGSDWRLSAEGDLVVLAGSSDMVLGIDATDGQVRWRRQAPIGWWGGLLVADGLAFLPTIEEGVMALRLADGGSAWTWSAWPGGKCGPSCLTPSSAPRAVAKGVLFVTSQAGICREGTPECDTAFYPYRTRVTALDAATGRQLWTRQVLRPQPFGEVAIVDDVAVVGAGDVHMLDLATGAQLRVVPAPQRPDTFGAQHSWAGQPIPTGSWLILGAADGTVTAFSIATETARTRPGSLVRDLTLEPTTPVPPTPTGSLQPPTPSPPPPMTEGPPAWWWVALAGSAISVGVVLAAAFRRSWSRRSAGLGPHA